MLNQKKWFGLFVALFLGLAAYVFAPKSFVRTANAEAKNVATIMALDEGHKVEETNPSFELLSAEDVWKDVFQDLKYGEMTDKKLAALALAEVKNRDLALMSSSTDHIVNYHGKRFAITEFKISVYPFALVMTECRNCIASPFIWKIYS